MEDKQKTFRPANHLILVLPVEEKGVSVKAEDLELTHGIVVDAGYDFFYFPDGTMGRKKEIGVVQDKEIIFNASNALPYYIDNVCHYLIGVMQVIGIEKN